MRTVFFSSYLSSCLTCLDKMKDNHHHHYDSVSRYVRKSKCRYFQEKCPGRGNKEPCVLERYEKIIDGTENVKDLIITDLNELEKNSHYTYSSDL